MTTETGGGSGTRNTATESTTGSTAGTAGTTVGTTAVIARTTAAGSTDSKVVITMAAAGKKTTLPGQVGRTAATAPHRSCGIGTGVVTGAGEGKGQHDETSKF